MGDEFNENDLADLNSDAPAASEAPDLTPEQEANIDAAMERFFGNADDEDLTAAKEGDAEATANEVARRRRAQREQREELVEEGLEDEDDQVQEGTEEDIDKAAKDKVETTDASAEQDDKQADKLDPTLRFFAEQELGWSAEKIDKLVAADPELAAEMIQGFVDQTLNLSRQFLQPNASQVAPGTQPVEQQPAQPASPTPKLDEFYNNLQAFAEGNGEELAEFLNHLKAEVIDPWKEVQARRAVEQEELLRTEVQTHFGALASQFAGIYGGADADVSKLDENQVKARQELGRLADQLRAGSRAAGRELSVKEALNKAHLMIASEYRAAQVRKEIKEQVQKRSRATTARPTQRRNPVTSTARSRAKAEEAVALKAAELGLDGWD